MVDMPPANEFQDNPTFKRILEPRPLPLPLPLPEEKSVRGKKSAKDKKSDDDKEPDDNKDPNPELHYDFREAKGMKTGTSSVSYVFTKVQIPRPEAVPSGKYVKIARDLVNQVMNRNFKYANGETLQPETVRAFPSSPVNLAHLADREQDAVIIMHFHDVAAGDEIWRLTDPDFGTILGSFTTEWGTKAAGVVTIPEDKTAKRQKAEAQNTKVHGDTSGSTSAATARGHAADPAGSDPAAGRGPTSAASGSAANPAGVTGTTASRHGQGHRAGRPSSVTASTISSRLHASTAGSRGGKGTTSSRSRSRANTGGSQGGMSTTASRNRGGTGGSRAGLERQESEHSGSETSEDDTPVPDDIIRQADYYANLSPNDLIKRLKELREAEHQRKRKRGPVVPSLSPWVECRIDSLYVRRGADIAGLRKSTSLPWAIPNGKLRPVYGMEAKRPGYVFRFVKNIEDWVRSAEFHNPSRSGRKSLGDRRGGYKSVKLLRGSRNLIYQCRGYCIIFRIKVILVYDGLACIFLSFPDMVITNTTTAAKLWAPAINRTADQGRMEIATMSGAPAILRHKDLGRQNVPLDAAPTESIPDQPEPQA